MISKLTSLLISMTALQTGFACESKAASAGECVILIHGLGRTSLSMKRLEWTLEREGYHVVNISYSSRKFRVEQLSEDYLRYAIAAIPREISKLHFVTHSMGGIILRQYLSQHSITNLGSVVMLAPPNQGSELADTLKHNALGRWILGPAGRQLGTASTDLPKQLGPVTFDTGVIAGNRSLNPLFSRIFPGENDGKVSVERARVEGMKEFLVLPFSHTWLMWRLKPICQIRTFLQRNSFAQFEPDNG